MFSADKAQEALIMLLYYMATILIGAAWCNKATALAQGQNEAESFSGKLLLEAFFVAFFSREPSLPSPVLAFRTTAPFLFWNL